MDLDRRRALLEEVLNDSRTAASDRLRAAELLDRLDVRSEDAERFEIYRQLEQLTDEELARELEMLGHPLSSEIEEAVRAALADDGRVRREVERQVREQTQALRKRAVVAERERDEAREALRTVVPLPRPDDPPAPLPGRRTAPDTPESAQDAGAEVAALIARREKAWDDGPPRSLLRR